MLALKNGGSAAVLAYTVYEVLTGISFSSAVFFGMSTPKTVVHWLVAFVWGTDWVLACGIVNLIGGISFLCFLAFSKTNRIVTETEVLIEEASIQDISEHGQPIFEERNEESHGTLPRVVATSSDGIFSQ
ncbi:hypothetical protein L596_009796 [Steinernema carpocapsae]|uniref:Uncharacterized protein n=1 Tax=Steinernema carpocapsae TaxID=34508 RepID=A0A4U5PGQ3_STECR|nr:hypothetical protein L596_009796 [Steinernema carpocapsae]